MDSEKEINRLEKIKLIHELNRIRSNAFRNYTIKDCPNCNAQIERNQKICEKCGIIIYATYYGE